MDSQSNKAVALLSSGLDSAISMVWLLSEGVEIKLAITFDYGQRSRVQEISHAQAICQHYKIPHQLINLPWFASFASKGLLSRNEPLSQPSIRGLDNKKELLKSASQVWVPNRNGVFIEVAAGVAENQSINRVIVGFNAEEAVTFPDNSASYVHAVNKALALSTQNQVRIESPTIALGKSEIVAMGVSLQFPFHLLWSCYEEGTQMCGKCESCVRLKRALTQNGRSLDGLFKYPFLD